MIWRVQYVENHGCRTTAFYRKDYEGVAGKLAPSASMQHGLELIDQSEPKIVQLFKTLGEKYWPGPITLVVKANLDVIPLLVTAQTGFVGIRIPNHPIA